MEARIDNYNTWIAEVNPSNLKPLFEEMLMESGFGILNFMEHHFEPQGYTAVWLLAESHCALHTFPEEGKAYIEISSCNTDLFVNFVTAFSQYQKKVNAETLRATS